MKLYFFLKTEKESIENYNAKQLDEIIGQKSVDKKEDLDFYNQFLESLQNLMVFNKFFSKK